MKTNNNKVFFVPMQLLITFLLLIINSSALKSQHISIDGGNLVINGSMVISGNFDFYNSGTLTCASGSKVIFKGTQIQEINGSRVINFHNLEINNSSSGIKLLRSIGIKGVLTMTRGNIDLLGKNLNLSSSGVISGEHNGAMVLSSAGPGNYIAGQDAGDGQIIKSINITTSGVTNAGGLGIDITPTANFGNTTIYRKHQRIVGFNNDNSIFRTYTISPTNNANLEAQIVFKYNSANEMNGNSSGSLKMYQQKTGTSKGVEWEELTSTDNGNKVSATTNDNNLTEIILTAAGANKVLPVSLISFSAECGNNIVLLNWQTASETNNDYFKLERSINGAAFEEIAHIKGAGNSNVNLKYEFVDAHHSVKIVYYRLSQVDFDGKYEVFNIISSKCSKNQIISFSIANPVKNKQLTLTSTKQIEKNIYIKIFSSTGSCVLHKMLEAKQSEWMINVDKLAKGVYYVVLQSNEVTTDTKSIIL